MQPDKARGDTAKRLPSLFPNVLAIYLASPDHCPGVVLTHHSFSPSAPFKSTLGGYRSVVLSSLRQDEQPGIDDPARHLIWRAHSYTRVRISCASSSKVGNTSRATRVIPSLSFTVRTETFCRAGMTEELPVKRASNLRSPYSERALYPA
jgi:hypothetical protein